MGKWKMSKFENIISLGFFCSCASELERIGLRKASYPFDWLISPLPSVISLMNNQFEGFLDYDLLEQNISKPAWYRNKKYNIQFFHDFNKYHSLSSQIKKMQKKYERRIVRFYESIQLPTLFLRYVSCQQEIDYIEENANYISSYIKEFNTQNHIIYIANTDIHFNSPDVFFVEPDEADIVARKFLDKNLELKKMLISSTQMDGLSYRRKKKKTLKPVRWIYKTFIPVYRHLHTYE